MLKRHWLQAAVALALLRSLTLCAYAQDGIPGAAGGSAGSVQSRHSNGSGSFGFESRMGKAVGLTPEQRDTVRGMLAEQRQQRTALQEQTDVKIRTMLNPDQQKKFDTFINQQKQERAARYRKPS